MVDNEEIVESVQPEKISQEQTPQETAAQPQQETAAQLSWRQLREKAEQAERKAQELERIIANQRKEHQQQASNDDDDEISIQPDDLVEGKHLNKYNKKLRKLEQQLSEYKNHSSELVAENRIKQEFPDFDKVVNEESLYILQTQFPELAQSIKSNPDLYSKAKAAHLAITKLGINPNDVNINNNQNIIDKNLSKPRPVASIAPQVGDSPLTRANAFANGLTDELKQQLYKEMIDAKNSR